MARIGFASGASNRTAYGLPEARLVNLFSEVNQGDPIQSARLPRPGLVEYDDNGSGPVRGLFQEPGLFGGAVFQVSGTTLYKDGSSVGTITGTGMVRFAASSLELVIVSDGTAWTYDGTALAEIDDTDLPDVVDVAFLAGRFVYGQSGGDRFYWSDTNDAASIDGLSFSSAEASADQIVGLLEVSGSLLIFGGKTVEFWAPTGDNDDPFQRSSASRLMRGCGSRDSIVAMDNTAFWVGEDCVVYRAESAPQRVSTHGIEAALRRTADLSLVRAFEAPVEGHKFYVLKIPGEGSFVYDVATQQWAEWSTYEADTFRGQCGVLVGSSALVGDDDTGQIWTLTPGVYADDGDPITFLASAFISLDDGPERCNNIVLQGARGVGLATGQGSAPLTEMRYSDDQGKTWCDWRQASLGAVGEYSRRAVWQQLGMIREPGRLIEIRTTDPVLATMTGLLVNVKRPHG